MSDANIKAILDELGLLKKEVEGIKNEICLLKKKKLYIEDIGIGSFMGWVKLTTGIVLFVVSLFIAGHTFFSQIDVLRTDYGSHLKYLHKNTYSPDNKRLTK
jgi:hypothetical protein